MKLRLLSILIPGICLFSSCENEEIEAQWVDVTIIGEAVDCKENWIVRYENPLAEDEFDRFQEIGLPSEYKNEGLELMLKIRDPKNEELFPCTAVGISYPFKVILEANRK
ncbi:MAG TPA: hypothetical protein VJ973_05670 [Christiangramia sp.]|nr:hypothetical protein [Christiangramia sp.]